MAPAPVSQKQNKSRRRKKRRTQDSSSESSSDSSDLSDNEVYAKEEPVIQSNGDKKEEKSFHIDDIEIESDHEAKDKNTSTFLPESTLKEMESIPFTSTEKQPIAQAIETVKKDRQSLESAFLAQMATTFAGQLDELRKKPDFTDKSIVLLAKTLQSGSNMFDDETLEALLQD